MIAILREYVRFRGEDTDCLAPLISANKPLETVVSRGLLFLGDFFSHH